MACRAASVVSDRIALADMSCSTLLCSLLDFCCGSPYLPPPPPPTQVCGVEAVRAVRKGEALSMDYGPDKLDNTLLLDYGVLDTASAKVRP